MEGKGKIFAIILIIVAILGFVSCLNECDGGSSGSHKCGVCGRSTNYTYRNGKWLCSSCAKSRTAIIIPDGKNEEYIFEYII